MEISCAIPMEFTGSLTTKHGYLNLGGVRITAVKEQATRYRVLIFWDFATIVKIAAMVNS